MGIFLLLFSIWFRSGAWNTVRVTKVKVHASEADVENGRVREEDRLGNAEGRRRQ